MARFSEDEGTLEELPPEGILSAHHDDLHLVLECDRPLEGATRHCLHGVDEVHLGRGPRRRVERRWDSGLHVLALEVPDSRMSSRHAKLRRADGHWVMEDRDSRNGSYVEGRRIARAPLVEGTRFELGHTQFLFRSSLLPRPLADGPLDVTAPSSHEAALATLSHERQALFRRLVEVARAGTSILLIGEAGCGKDTLARAIHAEAGGRSAFVVVHGVLLGRRTDAVAGEDDVTTELARDFDRAAGGTLFFDGIEELSPVAQLALLPLLKSARRAGVASIVSSVRSSDPRPAVPRIPADLLAELAGFSARVPPLRERREDIGTLVAHLVRRAAAGDRALLATTLDPAMGRALLLHDWPYNLSELDRCV
ncbi:MAG: sigma 54-interacting transcriptional regulator, partial [Myxococcota bacterium]|nr:sigma 54-interacting transcriptional regulator [Myxococcota bacterium]